MAHSTSARIVWIFLLLGILSCRTAAAARVTDLQVKLDQKVIFHFPASDQGNLSQDEVWEKLGTAVFKPGWTSGEFEFEPDETNGNRMTIRGDIDFAMRYGGDAKLDVLRLIRVAPQSDEWKLAPLELKRITRLRNAAMGKPDRPNVVVVISDDIRWNALGCAGHPHLKTPNIDQLAREGVYFENMFCTTSLCSPSRATILSGLYAHVHGVTNNFTDYPKKLPSFPRQLQKAGYETAYVGKWHMGEKDDSPRPGFDHFVTHRGQGTYYDHEFNFNGKGRRVIPGYYTNIVTDLAIDWMNQTRDKPFLLMVGQKAPHSFYLPEEKYAHTFDDVEVNYPQSSFMLDDKPAWMKKRLYTWHGIYGPIFAWRKDHPNDRASGVMDFARMVRSYWGTVLSVDDSIGQLTQALRESGELDNTVFVFIGDNGLHEGENGMVDKRTMHEASIRIPMIIRYPGFTPPDRPKRIPQQVVTIDLAPTLVDVCGADPMPKAHGKSFKQLVTVGDDAWRDSWFYHYNYEKQFPYTPNIRGVRTDRWKYIRYPHGDGTPDRHMSELYDMKSDPQELKNLINVPNMKPLIAKLGKQLDKLMQDADIGEDKMPLDEGIKSALPEKGIR